jgi:hypothetical protein
VTAPAWVLTSRDMLSMFQASRPDLAMHLVVERPADPRAIAVRVEPR